VAGLAILTSSLAALALADEPVALAGTADLVVGQGYNGRTVKLKIGQKLVIKLHGNPSTGHQWLVSKVSGNGIKQVGSVRYVPDPTPPGTVGAGGVYIATFRAVGTGTAKVALKYARPWETNVKPDRTFALNVKAGG
jgi:inhibitor of cysteine peptidase